MIRLSHIPLSGHNTPPDIPQYGHNTPPDISQYGHNIPPDISRYEHNTPHIPLSGYNPPPCQSDGNISEQPRVSHFQVLFESALQDYERQTGITLANHPLAEQLQTCQSAESVTAFLQEQARTLSGSRESDKIMGSLKNVVSVLLKISATAALGQDFGTVCPRPPVGCSTDLNACSIVVPTCGCDTYWPWYTTHCMGLISFYDRILLTFRCLRRSRASLPTQNLPLNCSSR
jgi:hypothetical protein